MLIGANLQRVRPIDYSGAKRPYGVASPNFKDNKSSPHIPREGKGVPPPPEWKQREYIRDILPDGDPHKKS